MTQVIIREQLDVIASIQELSFAKGAQIIHAAESRDGKGVIDIWAEVPVVLETDYETEILSFYVAATGDPTDDNMTYLKTVVMKSGLVWHVYKVD